MITEKNPDTLLGVTVNSDKKYEIISIKTYDKYDEATQSLIEINKALKGMERIKEIIKEFSVIKPNETGGIVTVEQASLLFVQKLEQIVDGKKEE